KRVGEAEVKHVLHWLLAKVMVDAENSRLGKSGVQDRIEGLRRGKITPERLLDNHTGIVDDACLPQSFDDGAEHAGWDCQVVQWALSGTECLTQFCISCLVVVVSRDVLEQRAQLRECVL